MARSSTNVERICADAAAESGLDDFGDTWFLEPLSAWAEDLQQANLNDFGRRFLYTLAVRDVARRLRVLATLRDNPEIGEVPIPPIVYITGMERSGTTFLHNLLALHPQSRALQRWELMEPVPPPTTATYRNDPRIAKVQRSVDRLRGSMLERMHWVNADDPEECVWGYIDAVSMLGQSACMCMPAWRRFLSEADLTAAFTNYRRVIQLLLWRHPVAPGGFLVLKAPQIGRSVGALARAFPELRFVITDRDPFRCIVSSAALGESIVDPFCVTNPMTNDGCRDRVILSMAVKKLDAIDGFTTAAPELVTHIPYPALVQDPVRAVRSALGRGPGDDQDLGDAITGFLEAQTSGARAAPPKDIPTMGYDRDDIWTEPTICAYATQFGIEPEVVRLTGAAP